MIRFATTEDIYVLKEMWDTGFDDPLNYINFIFDRVCKTGDVLVYDMAGSVAGMLTLLPVKFRYKNEAIEASYIFGATTERKYRGRGVMTNLLTAAEAEAKERGSKLTVLVPGEKALCNFYRKRGYSGDFFVRDIELLPGILADIPVVDTTVEFDLMDPAVMYQLREQALADIAHISWEQEQLHFVLDDCYIYGDNTAVYRGEHGSSYAVYKVVDRHVWVKECFGSSDMATLVLLKEVITANTARGATVRQPITSTLLAHEGVRTMYGMAKPLYIDSYIRDLDGYMNMMLD